MQRSWQKSLRESIGKRCKKQGDRKKKIIKKSSQENYQRGLQLRYYRSSQIKNTKDRRKEDGRKTGDDRKIPWNKKI